VLLNGTGASGGVESATLRNILIFRFWGGAGLSLIADAGAGIAYCSFYDVRVRHALTGYHLHATGNGGSFVNSNTFTHGAVSGGGFDYGIRLEGPGACNNNIFIGTVVEPYTKTFGHFVVSGANSQLHCLGCRAEGASLDEFAPLLVFGNETCGSVWDGGLTDGGRVTADPLNHDLRGCHGLNLKPSGRNLFPNSGFAGAGVEYGSVGDGDATPPFWQTTGAEGVAVSTSTDAWWDGDRAYAYPPPLLDRASVLNITVSPASSAYLKPKSAYGLWPPSRAGFLECSVGAWMRTCSTPSNIRAVATSIGVSGMVSGAPLPQDGEWHFVGLTAGLPDAFGSSPEPTVAFYFTHAGTAAASGSECVEVALPSFAFGRSSIAAREPQVLSDQGGAVQGTLSAGLAEVPRQASSYWTIPKFANTFVVTSDTVASGGSTLLARLNVNSADRFAPGTVLAFLFEVAGVTVSDSGYIDLTGGSFSSRSGDALGLLSLGSGTWRELWRNRAA
jgi:hypothetical protein